MLCSRAVSERSQPDLPTYVVPNAAVPTGPSPGAPKNPGLGAECAPVKALPPGVATGVLPPGVVPPGVVPPGVVPPGVAAVAGVPPGVAGVSISDTSPADGATTAGSHSAATTGLSTVGSAPKLRHADNESMPPIRILDGKVRRKDRG